MKRIEVNEQHAGKRLDLFLSLTLPEFSRSSVRKLLDMGKVSLFDRVEYRPNYKVRAGDVLIIQTEVDMQRKQLPAYDLPLEIAYQDSDIVIVNKPAGLKVHPSGLRDNQTLLNALYANLKDSVTDYGVNLVNRIDQQTSGLVVAAISPTGAWHYAKQFAEGSVEKHYLAVVSSRWEQRYGQEEVRLGNFLNYDWKERKQSIDREKGIYALTCFKLIQTNTEKGFSLLDVSPKSGRTHQIRVHLAHLHLPILGDIKYGGDKFDRLMLHSYSLNLTNPEGEVISVTTEFPTDFEELMK